MSAYGKFTVATSDDPNYKEGSDYDVVLNGDQTFNQYDGPVTQAAKDAAAAPAPAESTEGPAETQSTEQPSNPGA